jgi:hypothetical protein
LDMRFEPVSNLLRDGPQMVPSWCDRLFDHHNRVIADSYFSVAHFHSCVHDHFKATIDHALSVKRHRVSVRL